MFSQKCASAPIVQASLKEWESALADAQKCVELKPDWAKGYSRLGGALFGQGKHQEAVGAYKKGLDVDPDNAMLKKGLEDAQQAMRGSGALRAKFCLRTGLHNMHAAPWRTVAQLHTQSVTPPYLLSYDFTHADTPENIFWRALPYITN
jgi:tetratricopeptide (TPR) repeat protein